MNSQVDCSLIKYAKAEEIKIIMEEESQGIKDVRAMHGMRNKALDLCKKGQITLERMQLFFHTGMLNNFVGSLLDEKYQKDNSILKIMNKTQDTKKRNGDKKRKKDTFNGGSDLNEEIAEVALLKQEIKSEGKEGSLLKALKTFAATTVPDGLLLKCSGLEEAQVGIFSFKEVEKDAIFGPCVGSIVCDRQDAYDNGYCWDIYINNEFHHCVDARNAKVSNWMRYVNPSDSAELQNLEAFQREYQIYFRAIKDIPAGTELLVWYSLQYNQDCHLNDPDIDSSHGKSLKAVVSTIKRSTKMLKVEKFFKCHLCNNFFRKMSHLNEHECVHTREKGYECDLCDKAFYHTKSLKNHQRIHTEEKPHSCSYCDKSFPHLNALVEHERTHTGEKPFKCTVCQSSFATLSNLRAHKRIHTGEKPHNCHFCGRSFLLKQELVRHIRTHTGEKPFKCEICDRLFADRSTRNVHLRTHCGERAKCEICGKKFSDLSSHICSHSSDMNMHQCDICHKLFTASASLRNHQRIHTGEKPFACDFCNRAFTKNNDLKRHRTLHTGEKPYKCQMCSADFRLRAQLNKHMCEHSSAKHQAKCHMLEALNESDS